MLLLCLRTSKILNLGCFRLAFIGAKYSVIHDFDPN